MSPLKNIRIVNYIAYLSICCIILSTCVNADTRILMKHSRHKRFAEMADDIKGPYCALRSDGQCCPGRDDQCTMPILDTLCYCDLFCNNTASDCCPDFSETCLGVGLPVTLSRGCQSGGNEYRRGHVLTENCNTCTCIYDALFPNQHRWNCTKDVCLIRPKVIQHVNTGDYGWEAGNYSDFWGLTLEEGFHNRLGTKPPDPFVLGMSPIRTIRPKEDLPEFFDAREKWPNFIQPIRDQGNCGASWAFSTVATASDRLAIESSGNLGIELSPQHLLSCDTYRGQSGCDGGHLDKAWWFLRKRGVVADNCYQYTSGNTSKTEDCLLPTINNRHKRPCPDKNTTAHVLYSTPVYRIAKDEKAIMNEIKTNGPVQALMEIHEDFFMYKSGVYRHTDMTQNTQDESNDTRPYHSVRIIGWGSVNNTDGTVTKYWLCANSWGQQWGERGYFRIRRLDDCCKMEHFILAAFSNIVRQMPCSRTWLECLALEREAIERPFDFYHNLSTMTPEWTAVSTLELQRKVVSTFALERDLITTLPPEREAFSTLVPERETISTLGPEKETEKRTVHRNYQSIRRSYNTPVAYFSTPIRRYRSRWFRRLREDGPYHIGRRYW